MNLKGKHTPIPTQKSEGYINLNVISIYAEIKSSQDIVYARFQLSTQDCCTVQHSCQAIVKVAKAFLSSLLYCSLLCCHELWERLCYNPISLKQVEKSTHNPVKIQDMAVHSISEINKLIAYLQ